MIDIQVHFPPCMRRVELSPARATSIDWGLAQPPAR